MIGTDNEGFTQTAMQATPNAFAPGQQGNPNEGISAVFHRHAVEDPVRSLEEGRPIYTEQDYIKIFIVGSKSTIIDRPVRFGSSPKHDNNRFAGEYAAFKQGQEQALEGTPLAEWPIISKSQLLELEWFHVKTVEQLANLADSSAQNFQAILALREKARAYLLRAKEEAPINAVEGIRQEYEQKMAAMQDTLDAMANEMKGLKDANKTAHEELAGITKPPTDENGGEPTVSEASTVDGPTPAAEQEAAATPRKPRTNKRKIAK
jgi:hypothetical protein